METGLIKKNLKVELVGYKKTNLAPEDHLFTGGEGVVYKKGNKVIKIFKNLKKVKQENLIEKVKLLAFLFKNKKGIAAPENIVVDTQGKEIGYYMSYIKGKNLPTIIPTSFWKNSGFDFNSANHLVENMRQIMLFVHQQKAILGDANEMNWLVDLKNIKKPFAWIIDIDSWKIKNWPPTAISPSIIDWHHKLFTEESDWFAWAVVTFQIYTGIHPYKGKAKGYKWGDLEKRMKENVSVFSPGVKLNRAVRDFKNIPILDWYISVFQKKERSIPPSPLQANKTQANLQGFKTSSFTAAENLIWKEIFCLKENDRIINFKQGLVFTEKSKVFTLNNKLIHQTDAPKTEVIQTKNGWLFIEEKEKKLKFFFLNKNNEKKEIKLSYPTTENQSVFCYKNRLFVVENEKTINEIIFKEIGKKTFLLIKKSWNIPLNGKMFPGVGIFSLLGNTFFLLPYNKESCQKIKIKELNDYNLLAAKREENFIGVVTYFPQNGKYYKFYFLFDEKFQQYKCWKKEAELIDLNFVYFPSKEFALFLEEDNYLTAFAPKIKITKKIPSKKITANQQLVFWENKVFIREEKKIWQINC